MITVMIIKRTLSDACCAALRCGTPCPETKDTPDAPAAAKKELEKLGPMSRCVFCFVGVYRVCVLFVSRVCACVRVCVLHTASDKVQNQVSR